MNNSNSLTLYIRPADRETLARTRDRLGGRISLSCEVMRLLRLALERGDLEARVSKLEARVGRLTEHALPNPDL